MGKRVNETDDASNRREGASSSSESSSSSLPQPPPPPASLASSFTSWTSNSLNGDDKNALLNRLLKTADNDNINNIAATRREGSSSDNDYDADQNNSQNEDNEENVKTRKKRKDKKGFTHLVKRSFKGAAAEWTKTSVVNGSSKLLLGGLNLGSVLENDDQKTNVNATDTIYNNEEKESAATSALTYAIKSKDVIYNRNRKKRKARMQEAPTVISAVPKKTNKDEQEDDSYGSDEDLVGSYMTELLNSGKIPAFQRPPSPTTVSSSAKGVSSEQQQNVNFSKESETIGKRRQQHQKQYPQRIEPLITSKKLRKIKENYWVPFQHKIQNTPPRQLIHDIVNEYLISFVYKCLIRLKDFTTIKVMMNKEKNKRKNNANRSNNRWENPPLPPLPAVPTNRQSMTFLLMLFCVCILFLSILSTYLLNEVSNSTLYSLSILFALLFDYEEVKSLMPTFVQKIYNFIQNASVKFDEEVLLGKNYIGRYWENDSTVFGNVKAGRGKQQQKQEQQSKRRQRHESLLFRPPPTCISAYTAEIESSTKEDKSAAKHMKAPRRGGIYSKDDDNNEQQKKKIGRKHWKCRALDGMHIRQSICNSANSTTNNNSSAQITERTLEHTIAINFCYVMLRSGEVSAVHGARHVKRARKMLEKNKKKKKRMKRKKQSKAIGNIENNDDEGNTSRTMRRRGNRDSLGRHNSFSIVEKQFPRTTQLKNLDGKRSCLPPLKSNSENKLSTFSGSAMTRHISFYMDEDDDDDDLNKKKRRMKMLTNSDYDDDTVATDNTGKSHEDDSYAIIERILSKDDKKQEKDEKRRKKGDMVSDCIEKSSIDTGGEKGTSPAGVIVQVSSSKSENEYDPFVKNRSIDIGGTGSQALPPLPISSPRTQESVEVVKPLRRRLRDDGANAAVSQKSSRKEGDNLKKDMIERSNSSDGPGSPKTYSPKLRERHIQSFDYVDGCGVELKRLSSVTDTPATSSIQARRRRPRGDLEESDVEGEGINSLYRNISFSSASSLGSSYISGSTTTYGSYTDDDGSSLLPAEDDTFSFEYEGKNERKGEKLVKSRGNASGEQDGATLGKSVVAGKDLNWIDVGAKIGIRLLNSKEVQRAIVNPGDNKSSGGVGRATVTSKSMDVGTNTRGGETSAAELAVAVEKNKSSSTAVAARKADNPSAPATLDPVAVAAGMSRNSSFSSIVALEEAVIHAEEGTRDLDVIDPNKAASAVVRTALMNAARPVHAMYSSPSGAAVCDDSTDGGGDDNSSISELTFDQYSSPQTKTPTSRAGSVSKLLVQLSPPMEGADSMDTASPFSHKDPIKVADKCEEFDIGQEQRGLTDTGEGSKIMNRGFDNKSRSLDLESSVDLPSSDEGEGMVVTASGRFLVEGANDVDIMNSGDDNGLPPTETSLTKNRRMIDRRIDLGTTAMAEQKGESFKKVSHGFDAKKFLPSNLNGLKGMAAPSSCTARSAQPMVEMTDRSLPLLPISFESNEISTPQKSYFSKREVEKSPLLTSSALPSRSLPQQQPRPQIHRDKSILLPSHSQHKRRPRFSPGIKMVVPMFQPYAFSHLPRGNRRKSKHRSIQQSYQMATVVSSKRIYVEPPMNKKKQSAVGPNSPNPDASEMPRASIRLLEKNRSRQNRNNCVSVTVILEKSFLRDGRFAEMTLRILDEKKYAPRSSKFPIGSCVATSFGIGVLVGWRVEDDCHMVRSLWQRRGLGSALAYLNRSAVHCVMEAAVGFHVETSLGHGVVVAYVHGGKEFHSGKYFVRITQRGRHNGNTLGFNRRDVLSCKAAPFIPVIEQVRESAQYQIQLDMYKSALRQRQLESSNGAAQLSNQDLWRTWSRGIDLFINSLLKAIEDDENFDFELNKFVQGVIDFLENAVSADNSTDEDKPLITLGGGAEGNALVGSQNDDNVGTGTAKSANSTSSESSGATAGFWFLDDLFGGVGGLFPPSSKDHPKKDEHPSATGSVSNLSTMDSNQFSSSEEQSAAISGAYQTAFAVIKTIMRTVAIARASIPDKPKVQMALSIVNEVLLFIRAVIKVQQKNMSQKSLSVWKQLFKDIAATFGPMEQRLAVIGQGLAERLEKQGNQAKIRLLRFVDIILVDDRLLQSIELRDWSQCITRLEIAAVRANMIDAESCAQYHKSAVVLYNMLAPRDSESDEAAARNGEKFALFAKALKWTATPKRSILKLLTRDDVLEVVERILVRVFQKEKDASQMLSIYASYFHTFRHLRMLNNRAITGKLWKPLLDAADEEFAWAVSQMPGNAKEFTEPMSKLFSLGVAKFNQMGPSNSNNDWLDFLMEDEAIKIIQEIDMKAQKSVRNFYSDVKKVTEIMPYYSSIDNDILNLLDEVELDKILKEAAEALTDTQNFAQYVREKSAIILRRFLDYLPKMSIPVEKRDLGDGWVLTCTGKHGSDLRLSDMHFEKENLVCQVMGGGNVFSPMFGDDDPNDSTINAKSSSFSPSFDADESGNVEVSILDHIRELVANAQNNGCWTVEDPSSSKTLDGLPVSEVLGCAIELWQNLEIDDDELLEIAIRDISYHIQMQKNREEGNPDIEIAEKQWSKEAARLQLDADPPSGKPTRLSGGVTGNRHGKNAGSSQPCTKSYDDVKHDTRRFNPRKDPTVLYLDITKLTFNLDDFLFRVEKAKPLSIFDPVFDGVGKLAIKNVSLRIRIECRKERIKKSYKEVEVPVLQLQDLAVQLEKVKFKFKETGADWLLNSIIKGFGDNITEVVKTSLKEELNNQIHTALEQLNAHIEANPDVMLNLLGITIDDLEENVVLV